MTLLAGGAKLGGILAERSGSAVVVGIGLNVYQRLAELPEDAPRRCGSRPPRRRKEPGRPRRRDRAGASPPDLRTRVLVAVLTALSQRYLAWRDQFSPGDAEAVGSGRSTWPCAPRSAGR